MTESAGEAAEVSVPTISVTLSKVTPSFSVDDVIVHAPVVASAYPPDVSATMLDGTKINGLNDLVAAIDKDRELVVRTVIENLFVFSIGRAVYREDYPLILHLTRESAKNDYRLGSILETLILSDAFRKQKTAD